MFASGYLIFYIRINLEFHAICWKQLLSLWILISRTANSRGSQPPPRHMVCRRPFAFAVVVEACWTPRHRQQSSETIRPPGLYLGVWTALPHGSHVRMVVKKCLSIPPTLAETLPSRGLEYVFHPKIVDFVNANMGNGASTCLAGGGKGL